MYIYIILWAIWIYMYVCTYTSQGFTKKEFPGSLMKGGFPETAVWPSGAEEGREEKKTEKKRLLYLYPKLSSG